MTDPDIAFTEYAGHRIASITHPRPDSKLLPIVWVHGLTASVRFWEAAMLPEIRNSRAWYSVSLPLHYPSTYAGEPHAEALNEHLFAELLARPLDTLIPEGKFHLAGYSLGAFSCLNYAAKYPERVASVISIGGFMTGRAKGLEGVLQFFAQGAFFRRAFFATGWWVMQRHVIFLKLATLTYARKWKKLLNYPELDPTLKNIFPDVSRHSITAQRELFRYLLAMNLMDEIDDIATPVLVIAGENDPIIPYAHQQAYAARLQNCRLVSLPGVGHVSFAEAPEEFERELLGWLKKLG